MQYILTEEEYTALKTQRKHEIKLGRDKLQKLCTEIAISMPIKVSWRLADDQPWGCILSKEHDSMHCDDCPVTTICPHDSKSWSQ